MRPIGCHAEITVAGPLEHGCVSAVVLPYYFDRSVEARFGG